MKATILSLHQSRRAPLLFEQHPTLVSKIAHLHALPQGVQLHAGIIYLLPTRGLKERVRGLCYCNLGRNQLGYRPKFLLLQRVKQLCLYIKRVMTVG